MSTNNLLDIHGAEVQIPENASALSAGPQWLREIRRRSAAYFNAAPLPPRGLHLWRYTDPAAFLMVRESDSAAPAVLDLDETIRLEAEHVSKGGLAQLVVDYGGREIRTFGGDSLSGKGVVVAPLSEAAKTHNDIVEKHLYSLVSQSLGKFEALNSALWNDGIFIQIPDNTTIEKPIHLLREAGGPGTGYYPRLLVVVGRNSEVTLIDEYAGGSGDSETGVTHVNGSVEIVTGDDSRVRYVSVERHGAGTNLYLTHRANIGRNAQMLTIPLAFGGNVIKQNFGVILGGRGANSRMFGMLFGSEHQHFDNHTLHEHRLGNTTSDIDFKVVLRDRAVSAYTGLIRIEQDAPTCEAYQENRNLLLNRGPRAETIPELEILNEDVKCTHGATIGPIDPEAIFYLKSRGIEKDEAVRMIVSGFVGSTLRQIPDDLRDRISGFVEERLRGI